MSSSRSSPSHADLDQLPDDELLRLLARRQAEGGSLDGPLELLRRRWTAPARHVIGRILRSYGQSTEEAEDLVQESFTRLLERGLGQFRGAEGRAHSARAFFLRVAKHHTIDQCRRRKEHLAASGPDGDPSEPGESGASTGEESRHQRDEALELARDQERRRESSQLYWSSMRRLEREHPNEAEAWKLYHHAELEDHQACAERLGISLANSYKRVSRAQAYLKVYLLELSLEVTEDGP
jgi:RNA polymerase sigma-70 factor, ECF subfamily